ncbi:MAG: outer membrane lipoprotein-sorting protein [Firmicutes bacterium]|nr:outer membrane lipoprotein-sorting protein [Bacillota bacterium]
MRINNGGKKVMKKSTIITSVFLLLIMLSVFKVESVGAISGEEVLARVEDAMKTGEDMQATEKMTLIDSEGNQEVRKLELYQKGSEKMLMRFLEPADIRGVGVLLLSENGQEDIIYLYMPAFRRERRIASHAKNQSFMGTDLSYEDMAQMNYSDKYKVVNMVENEGSYILTVEPKSDTDISYSKAEMKVDKNSFLPNEIKYYEGEKAVKKLSIPFKEKQEKYWVAKKMIVENLETNHQTIMEILEVKYDQDLDDRTFTVRNLRRFR